MLLAGDIGGTKTALALFTNEADPRAPVRAATFPSQQFASLEAVVREFLSSDVGRVDRACFGVAGPVIEGTVRVTNLAWSISEAALRAEFGFSSVRLLNDVQATAQAIPILRDDEVETVVDGEAVPHGAIALVAPGTGLGEAFVIWDGGRYRAYPSEGGHADFAPTTEEQAGLLWYARDRYRHVSYERVCSGIGIPLIYEYLRDSGYATEGAAVAERLSLSEGADRTRVIIEAAAQPAASVLCARAVDVFVSILGAEAGNLALKVLATGGVYLAGGIPRSVLPFLRQERFQDAYRDKGRFSELISAIPVRVITGEAALLGAALRGLQEEE